jgi:hypothetical protein
VPAPSAATAARVAALPAPWRATVRAALAARRLPLPADWPALAGGPGALRGPAEAGPGGDGTPLPLAPVATTVRRDRPAFRWRPLPGASAHRVTVFDPGYRPVAESGPLAGDAWTPPSPLPRGVVLSWQLEAVHGGEPVTAPRPPAPEARFRVLTPAEVEEIEGAERLRPPAVARAVLYARAGLLAEAAAALRAAAGGPDAALAAEMLRRLPPSPAAAQEASPTSTNPPQ